MGVNPVVTYGLAPCTSFTAPWRASTGCATLVAGPGAGCASCAGGWAGGCYFSFFVPCRLSEALDQRRSPFAWMSRETSALKSSQGRAVFEFADRKKSIEIQRSQATPTPPDAPITLRRVFKPDRFLKRLLIRRTSSGSSSNGSLGGHAGVCCC